MGAETGEARFHWPASEGEADDSPLGQLPTSGPLAEFRRRATELSRPSDPSRPWVLAAGERVVKAYDLRAFDPIDRQRALAEAETCRAVSDIPGVVTTYRAGEVGNWLVIEMERLGETVAEHLAEVAAGERLPLGAALWGTMLEEVAEALDELHRRRVIHRDVKPANLMFDRAGNKLLLADFSIAASRRRRDEQEAGDVAGTRRYIAPEVFQNRMGYGVDQYGLAVTAEEILGEAATPAAREVLLRARDQNPEDRFGSVSDFAVQLRGAIDDTAPRRLSSRLRRVSPKWRHTWGLGAVVFAGGYLLLIAARIPHLGLLAGVFGPLLAAAATMALARLFNRFRRGRTQPRLGIADRAWFPVAVFVAVFVGVRPILANEPGSAGKYVLYDWLGSLFLASVLGSTPRDAGEWLIRLVRRWEGWRQPQRRRPARWWGARIAICAGLLAFSWLPAAVGNRWPNDAGPVSASEVRPLVAIARWREALLDGKPGLACAAMRIPVDADTVRCRRWAPLAARWLRDDVETGGAAPLTPANLTRFDVSFNERSDKYGQPSWSIWTADDSRDYAGSFSREDDAGRVWGFSLSRRPPNDDVLSVQRSYWEYEVVERDGRWLVTFVSTCDSTAPGPCVRLSQLDEDEFAELAREDAAEPRQPAQAGRSSGLGASR